MNIQAPTLYTFAPLKAITGVRRYMAIGAQSNQVRSLRVTVPSPVTVLCGHHKTALLSLLIPKVLVVATGGLCLALRRL